MTQAGSIVETLVDKLTPINAALLEILRVLNEVLVELKKDKKK